jgi:hypothetical protein
MGKCKWRECYLVLRCTVTRTSNVFCTSQLHVSAAEIRGCEVQNITCVFYSSIQCNLNTK